MAGNGSAPDALRRRSVRSRSRAAAGKTIGSTAISSASDFTRLSEATRGDGVVGRGAPPLLSSDAGVGANHALLSRPRAHRRRPRDDGLRFPLGRTVAQARADPQVVAPAAA